MPNRISSTNEFGLKFDWLQSRFVGTVAVFDTEETNFLLSLRDDLAGTVTGIPAPEGSILGEPYLAPAGTRSTEGWNIDLAMNPVEGLNMIGLLWRGGCDDHRGPCDDRAGAYCGRFHKIRISGRSVERLLGGVAIQ